MTDGKPTGIVVHSTGANNKTLKRYVQPLKTDANYNEIIEDIGKNSYNNHWNKSSVGKCVHAFIGVNKAGTVETYQTLPFDLCCWGVGAGKKGSYNYNPTARIQFEICEDNLKNEDYFNAAFKEAAEFCAYLCKKYDLGVETICSHAESYKAGYGSNHSDCDHWLKKFGKNMDWFRKQVAEILNPTPKEEKEITVKQVKKNSQNSSVKLAQVLLNGLGYKGKNKKALSTDGVCGTNTVYAIQAYQSANKLDADGILGRSSWQSLLGATKTTGSSTITIVMPTIKNNSKGQAVKVAQILLNTLGYKGSNGKVLSTDGICGANTVYAIKAYQKANGLEADGIVGKMTWLSLLTEE
jgi:peptidoglycan hydrolase-like protein with peptidoglycan-binding domain